MTRHKTSWWSSMFPTSPQRLLRQPAGERLVDVLTEWWTTLEGFADGTWSTVDHSRRAAEYRYSRPTFYARLDAIGFPVLADGDEHAMDEIFDGFRTWTRSRKARKLIDRLADDLSPDSTPDHGHDHSGRIHQDVQHGIHQQVHQHVAHQVHQHVHAQVHHAVSHAAHSAGGGGHAGGHH